MPFQYTTFDNIGWYWVDAMDECPEEYELAQVLHEANITPCDWSLALLLANSADLRDDLIAAYWLEDRDQDLENMAVLVALVAKDIANKAKVEA